MTRALILALGLLGTQSALARDQWTPEQAAAWSGRQPWLVGANYIPASAVNQLEMWQAPTWDPARIDRELAWAEGIGMNVMRVFLHDQLWEQDAKGFQKRIDAFLAIAAKHHIKTLFVLFDSVWESEPQLGPQHPPIPGVHNSGWVQSPGMRGLRDTTRYPKYQAFIQGVIRAFANDDRVLGWDVWNEPDNLNGARKGEEDKIALVEALLPQVFAWARAASPSQPLTSGVWIHSDWSRDGGKLTAIETTQLTQSDVISFHDYSWPEVFESRVQQLATFGRPILCTEFMARGAGSTFDGSLPVGKRYNVAMMSWGLVDGKSQTRLPWDSWRRPYTMEEPTVWFHDVFHADGTPYRTAEADLIRRLVKAP